MATVAQSVHDVCVAAKQASHELARTDRAAKDACLLDLADRIEARTAELLEANVADVEAGREEGLTEALIDRLTLTGARIAEMASGVREIAELEDPVGEIAESWTLENGLRVQKQRAPLGVIGIIYEARPNVTVDAAALCLKSGNAVVLRGSSAAETSNGMLAGLIAESLAAAGLPEAAVTLLAGGGREQLGELATQEGLVDLIIPRGGEGLKNALKAVAKVPVMYAAAGNCHVYVHEDADLEMARRIAYNAKVQRPGVCNAAETLLVHESVAADVLPPGENVARPSSGRGRGCRALRGCGADGVERDAGLLAKGGEVEVDALACHAPVREGRDVGERHADASAGWRHAEPCARASQVAPGDHHVVAERGSLVIGGEVGKGGEVADVGRPGGRPALAAKAQRHRLQIAVLGEGLEHRVVVAPRLRLTVNLEQPRHLRLVHDAPPQYSLTVLSRVIRYRDGLCQGFFVDPYRAGGPNPPAHTRGRGAGTRSTGLRRNAHR